MLYIVAVNEIDATVWARELGIALRNQVKVARGITLVGHVPTRFEAGDIVQATPQFADPDDGSILMVRRAAIRAAILEAGGILLPPYDVPDSLDRESVEEWLRKPARVPTPRGRGSA